MRQVDGRLLLEKVKQFVGTEDLGDPIHDVAFEQLMLAFEHECRLEESRVKSFEVEQRHFLASRGKAAMLLRKHPEILDQDIGTPVFIVGMPRTGSTMLHNVLARHPDHFAHPLWMLQFPIQDEPTYEAYEIKSLLRSARSLELFYQDIPEAERMHPMHPRWPDECNLLFRMMSASMVFAMMYPIPSYLRWLQTTDMLPYCHAYRRILQLLRFQHRNTKRLILKDPCHMWHLRPLLEVFPDSKVIFLHRRMDEVVPSFASLCFAAHRRWTEHKDPQRAGTYMLDLLEQGLSSALEARTSLDPARFLDIEYRDMMADRRGSLERICHFIGARFDEESLAAMEQWIVENPQHKAGRHIYSLEQFGYRAEEFQERFRAYHEVYVPQANSVIA